VQDVVEPFEGARGFDRQDVERFLDDADLGAVAVRVAAEEAEFSVADVIAFDAEPRLSLTSMMAAASRSASSRRARRM
jgi:hypothetical protein